MEKTRRNKEGRIMSSKMMVLMAFALTCGIMSTVAFAAPVSDGTVQREMNPNVVWDTIKETADETDLSILEKYMDVGELTRLKNEKNVVSDILIAYCDFDSDFENTLFDYYR